MIVRGADSYLIRRLALSVPEIRDHLGDVGAWRGVRVTEPGSGHAYRRIVHDYELCTGGRRFTIAANLFDVPSTDGALHDHRWPFAVLPLDLVGVAGTPLYDMPWEAAGDRGVVRVCSHEPWAIEQCEVKHAVRGLRPHVSIVLVDRTAPAARPQRLVAEPLDAAATAEIVARTAAAMRSVVE